jgi:hypothetical protein
MKRRFALIIIGIGFLLAAGLGYMEYSSLGFPDGYLSAYELETRDLRFAAIIANVALGALVCVGGLGWIIPPAALVLVVAAAFVVIAIPSTMLPFCPEIESCTHIYEIVTGHPLNHGIGG